MEELEWYLGGNHRNICQADIMTKTPATFHEPEMSEIIPDTVIKRSKMDAEMTYFNNNNIDEVIRQKLRKKNLYETDMHKIHNLIVGQTN